MRCIDMDGCLTDRDDEFSYQVIVAFHGNMDRVFLLLLTLYVGLGLVEENTMLSLPGKSRGYLIIIIFGKHFDVNVFPSTTDKWTISSSLPPSVSTSKSSLLNCGIPIRETRNWS